jgi:hypothetical protein
MQKIVIFQKGPFQKVKIPTPSPWLRAKPCRTRETGMGTIAGSLPRASQSPKRSRRCQGQMAILQPELLRRSLR